MQKLLLILIVSLHFLAGCREPGATDGFIGPHLSDGIGLNVIGATGTDKFNDVLALTNDF